MSQTSINHKQKVLFFAVMLSISGMLFSVPSRNERNSTPLTKTISASEGVQRLPAILLDLSDISDDLLFTRFRNRKTWFINDSVTSYDNKPVWDYADPFHPEYIGYFDTSQFNVVKRYFDQFQWKIYSDMLFGWCNYVDVDHHELFIYQLSNRTISYRSNCSFTPNSIVQDVIVNDHFLYIVHADYTPATIYENYSLSIYDITDLTNPTFLTHYDLPSFANMYSSVFLEEDILFITMQNVLMLNCSQGDNLHEIGYFHPSCLPNRSVSIYDYYHMLRAQPYLDFPYFYDVFNDSLEIYNVEDPLQVKCIANHTLNIEKFNYRTDFIRHKNYIAYTVEYDSNDHIFIKTIREISANKQEWLWSCNISNKYLDFFPFSFRIDFLTNDFIFIGSEGGRFLDYGYDSDGDLWTDGQETYLFGTDPFNADSDGDGYSDYTEIKKETDPLDPADFPAETTSTQSSVSTTTSNTTQENPFGSLPGYPFLLWIVLGMMGVLWRRTKQS